MNKHLLGCRVNISTLNCFYLLLDISNLKDKKKSKVLEQSDCSELSSDNPEIANKKVEKEERYRRSQVIKNNNQKLRAQLEESDAMS